MDTYQQTLFDIAKFLDEARWSNKENYETISGTEGLNNRQIILVHYLLYIMDRQMPYEIIWDKGGRVFTKIVKRYYEGIAIDELLKLRGDYVGCPELINPNKTPSLSFRAKDNDGEIVEFKSRFVSTDYKSIYATLYVLKELAGKDLIRFCQIVAEAYKDKEDVVRRIAYALHLMTYNCPAKPSEQGLSDYLSEIEKECNDILDNVKAFLGRKDEEGFEKFCKEQIYSSKRLWCSLRDYIKSPCYKETFCIEINKVLNGRKIEELTNQLELPGDVWNNNDNFVQCICAGNAKAKSTPFNKYLRKLGGEYAETDCFDVSFSLVPRVCKGKKDCACCPFGIAKPDIAHSIEKMCVNDGSKLCPILLYSTGYKMFCKGKSNCTLFKKHWLF